MIKLDKVSKTFSSGGYQVPAVDNVSLEVGEGKFVSIIGKSGSGKSTLLSLLGALDKPTSGTIIVGKHEVTALDDRDLNRYRAAKIGFVFQSYNLIPNLTAVENVMLPMEFAKVPKKEQRPRAEQLLEQVGITGDKWQRRPARLSGGEQQRVAIARAMANQPDVILADEPTGNLDSVNGKMIFDLLHDLAKKASTTIIVVTHDLSIAGKTDKTFQLSDGQLSQSNK